MGWPTDCPQHTCDGQVRPNEQMTEARCDTCGSAWPIGGGHDTPPDDVFAEAGR